ncbi:protein kinase [Colletotrichum sp. SAR11_57]|nr:protein kinase [Colletotrichum sp. SAR11_57]
MKVTKEGDIIAYLHLFADIGRRTTNAIEASSRYAPPLIEFTERSFDRCRLIVKDSVSLMGTEVTYDDEGHGKRSNFCCIIGGYKIPNEKHQRLHKGK